MQDITEKSVVRSVLRALRPDAQLSVSQWADEHRRLSGKAASEPGPWRTERTPYLREIMDCLSSSSPIQRVVFMKGAQIGGTEAGNNWIGYVIHHAPGPMLAILPTVEMAKRNSKQRLEPLIEESEVIRKLVRPARARDSGNTILQKDFQGGVLVLTGAPEDAKYECEHCQHKIEEHHKTWMLANGNWEAQAEGNARTAGFHLSSLYSPYGWRSWAQIARAWVDAQGSDAAIKSFKNTELGETYVETGEAPDWQRLYERRESYRIGHVPAGGMFITAGADVQKDRIEISIWAWGRDKESWLIDHRILEGDTGREAVWNKLTTFLGETWEHENGFDLPLRRLAVDSGYATQEVYAWARKQSQSLVMAIKGVARGAALVGLPSAVEITAGGKKLKRGLRVRPVAGGIAKLELFNNLRKVPPTKESGEAYPAGYVHLPQVDEEYLKQLCSEQLITSKNRRGYAVREWQKTRERNEALDCYVYARAAAMVEGLDRFGDRHWREMERSLGVDDPAATKASKNEKTKPAPPKPKGRRARSKGIKL